MIYVALGANLPSQYGSPRATIRRAILEIARKGIRVLYQSPLYLTAPVPISDQPWYHNAVIGVSTDKSPTELLKTLQSIENDFGRVRTIQNAARVIDLDIISYHDAILNQEGLTLPHPRMDGRAFVLYPLKDICRDWVHPVSKKHLDALLKELPSNQLIQKEYTPLVMGIVNVTPDSFSDGGQFNSMDKAIAHGLSLIGQGADILDIGGESTRPNAEVVPPEIEQERILPVIEALKNAGALISVDTRNSSTMLAALAAGAGMINDISALTWDRDSLNAVKDSDCRICLMHMMGTPQTMQLNPQYQDVVQDVYDFLEERIEFCIKQGIAKDRLMIDVGIGFAKTLEHNVALLQNLDKFNALGVDVLLGASRKSFIEKICEKPVPPQQRLPGSLAAALMGLKAKSRILRVHDVAETLQFINVYEKICA